MDEKAIAERVAKSVIARENWADFAENAVSEQRNEIKKWLNDIIATGQSISNAIEAEAKRRAKADKHDPNRIPTSVMRKAVADEIKKTWGNDKALPILADMLAEQKYIW